MDEPSLSDIMFRCGYLTLIANFFYVLSQFYLNCYSTRLMFLVGLIVCIVIEISPSFVRSCPAIFFLKKSI